MAHSGLCTTTAKWPLITVTISTFATALPCRGRRIVKLENNSHVSGHNQKHLITSRCKSESRSRTCVKRSSLTYTDNSISANVGSYISSFLNLKINPNPYYVSRLPESTTHKKAIFILHSQCYMRGSISSEPPAESLINIVY